MDINSRNLGQQEEDLDKKKFRKRASMSLSNTEPYWALLGLTEPYLALLGLTSPYFTFV